MTQPKQTSASKRFVFTVNNYTQNDVDKLRSIEVGQVDYLVFGKEVGDNNTPHLQGYVQFVKAVRFKTVKEAINERAHVEKAKGNPKQASDYCKKDGDFYELGTIKAQGRRTDLKDMAADLEVLTHSEMVEKYADKYIRSKRCLKDCMNDTRTEKALKKMRIELGDGDLRQWQSDVLKELLGQNERQVIFVVDYTGNQGKTWFAKWLVCNHNAFYSNSTVYNDVMFAYDNQPIVIFDMCRESVDRMNYGTLESMKNGIAFVRKYESKTRIFSPAKCIVFMNTRPDESKLSIDRYNIMNISDNVE